MRFLIVGTLSLVITFLILYFIQKQQIKEPSIKGDSKILMLPKTFAWLGILVLASLTFIAVFSTLKEGINIVFLAIISALVLGIAILTYRNMQIVRYRLNFETISKTNFWGKQEEMQLNKVKSVKMKGLLIPKLELFDGDKTLHCNPYVQGFRHILINLKRSGIDLREAGFPEPLLKQHNIT